MTRIDVAKQVYLDRQARKIHPAGHCDKGGRWYPSPEEEQPCCRGIRPPSRAFPWSLMTHCRAMAHVASLYNVDLGKLRRVCRETGASPRREGGDTYYKVVACVNGRYLSIFDGETEYRIGEELHEVPRQGHQGGYYVYPTVKAAQTADLPRTSRLLDAPRALLRVRAEGGYCRYEHKLAFSRITPLEVL